MPSQKSNPNRVHITRPAYVSYGHPDLDEASAFALDFGLIEVDRTESPVETRFYRGYGDQPLVYVVTKTELPVFLGATYEVESALDLDRALLVPGAVKREIMDSQPGGGERVSISGPDGVPFHLIYGQSLVNRQEPPLQFEPLNYPADGDGNETRKPRRGKGQRPQLGPAPVHKLGHCGYRVTDVGAAVDFYTTYFNFAQSDTLANPVKPGEQLFVFLHIDKGEIYSDHHSFFITTVDEPDGSHHPAGAHHAAFEVHDFDVQFVSHDFLVNAGYKPFWGVGRHVLGSQIFDYWYDKSGFVLEHYADGDIVNKDTQFVELTVKDNLSIWGPDMPAM
ncbi:hypothetical protein N7463_005696 [Penicillium fimorum]|uniref:VOC domain-containing protein n=1 Tax=Penicillium fimorum TaxID=1882269 RepID=A0A9X0C5G7_9EURO|nr:hypothetical protein N7463_005696 [Penicillium fimorum]